MVPPAPGRFSTINAWLLANCAKPADRLRDSVSAAPPAPTGTTRRTGRSGHCVCANAGMAESDNARATKRRLNDIGCSSIVWRSHPIPGWETAAAPGKGKAAAFLRRLVGLLAQES